MIFVLLRVTWPAFLPGLQPPGEPWDSTTFQNPKHPLFNLPWQLYLSMVKFFIFYVFLFIKILLMFLFYIKKTKDLSDVMSKRYVT
jgi:hypothetical protein